MRGRRTGGWAIRVLSLGYVRECLELAAEVSRSHPLIDVHVHATDIVTGEPGSSAPCGDRHAALRLRPIREPAREELALGPGKRARASEAWYRAAYRDAGPDLLAKAMRQAHVRAAVLLPVGTDAGKVEAQMSEIARTRTLLPGAIPGCTLPPSLPDEEVLGALARARDRFGARVVKVHHNLAGVDLRRAEARRRTENLLCTAAGAGLPVIVHGGRSPILGETEASRFAELENLAGIDWSAGAGSVVLAHCGLYGYAPAEARARIPDVQRLLAEHPRLWVDTSGLTPSLLSEVLRSLPLDRVLFGSDAHYVPMWQGVASTVHALAQSDHAPAAGLAAVASRNPTRLLGLQSADLAPAPE